MSLPARAALGPIMSIDPRRTPDDYLTRLARRVWPYSSVTVLPRANDAREYTLHRPGESDLVIAHRFDDAKASLRRFGAQADCVPAAHELNEVFRLAYLLTQTMEPGEQEAGRAILSARAPAITPETMRATFAAVRLEHIAAIRAIDQRAADTLMFATGLGDASGVMTAR
jgi:hypothetical protein